MGRRTCVSVPARGARTRRRSTFADAWNVYYRSIFNPARLMKRAMLKEMPKRYWANLPETRQIPAMARGG